MDFCPSQRNAQWSVEIDGEDVRAHGVPEHLLVLDRARRRRVDVLRALEVGPLEVRVVDEEVLRAGLAPDVPALLAGTRDRIDRLLARDVDDVERRAGDARELDRAVRRLAFGLRRTRERVEVRRRVPAASACFTRTSMASPFSACTITSAPVSAATSIVRKSVSSSTMSAPL